MTIASNVFPNSLRQVAMRSGMAYALPITVCIGASVFLGLGDASSGSAAMRSLRSPAPQARRDDQLAAFGGAVAGEEVYNELSMPAVHAAALLLDNLPSAIGIPHLAASEDGELGFSWFSGADRFEASIGAEGELAWITLRDGSFERGNQLRVLDRESLVPFFEAVSSFYESSSRSETVRV